MEFLNKLNDKNIIIKNIEKVELIIKDMKKNGKEKLHIVSDFDKTLTKAFNKGQKVISTYAIVRNSGKLNPEFLKLAENDFNKYHKYEIDTNLSIEEKSKYMDEWWQIHYEKILKYPFNKNLFSQVVESNSIILRDKFYQTFELLKKENIPILIFSAGYGDLILEFLNQKKINDSNVHVISNFLVYNENGLVINHKKPLIHVFNKNEIILKEFPYHNEIKERNDIILLGDSLGDLGMSEGMDYKNILKIGFLNENIENQLPLYEKEFDIVILNDGSLELVEKIIEFISN
jgi:HAD superfamily hydrolase (TIGR01544 family)